MVNLNIKLTPQEYAALKDAKDRFKYCNSWNEFFMSIIHYERIKEMRKRQNTSNIMPYYIEMEEMRKTISKQNEMIMDVNAKIDNVYKKRFISSIINDDSPMDNGPKAMQHIPHTNTFAKELKIEKKKSHGVESCSGSKPKVYTCDWKTGKIKQLLDIIRSKGHYLWKAKDLYRMSGYKTRSAFSGALTQIVRNKNYSDEIKRVGNGQYVYHPFNEDAIRKEYDQQYIERIENIRKSGIRGTVL